MACEATKQLPNSKKLRMGRREASLEFLKATWIKSSAKPQPELKSAEKLAQKVSKLLGKVKGGEYQWQLKKRSSIKSM
jgi:hypothetical protein